MPARWLLASNRVCATLIGSDLSWIALRNNSMCRSIAKTSSWILRKFNWTLCLASAISVERLSNALFVLLQQSHTEVAISFINVSVSLRNWEDRSRSDWDLVWMAHKLIVVSQMRRIYILFHTKCARIHPRFARTDGRIIFLDASIVVNATAEIVQLMTHRIDADGRLFVHNVLFQRILSRSTIGQLLADLCAFHWKIYVHNSKGH